MKMVITNRPSDGISNISYKFLVTWAGIHFLKIGIDCTEMKENAQTVKQMACSSGNQEMKIETKNNIPLSTQVPTTLSVHQCAAANI